MAPWNALIRVLLVIETALVERILASPRFHHAVRKIHRRVEDYRYGRDPNEPLRQGEATEEPASSQGGFLRYFIDELRNQIRGNPTDSPPPPSSSPPPPSAKR